MFIKSRFLGLRPRNDMGRGTTLLEMLISTGIFSLLVLAAFMFFDMGRTQWGWMNLGRKLGTDARTSMTTMERDLRRTNYSSIDIYTNPVATPPGWTNIVPRWAICMVGSGDPLNSNNFDPITGEPIWNKYIIYMATLQTGQGGEEGLGGAGSGTFLRIVATFNTNATTIRLPLHNPAFKAAVDWENANEFGKAPNEKEERFAGLDLMRSFVALAFTKPVVDGAGTQPANPAIDPVGANPDPNAAKNSITNAINTSLGASTLVLQSVNVSTIANVFALIFTKDDTTRTVSITFKTKGYANRGNGAANGFEARQIDAVFKPEY